jgi:hypothetical protein
MMAPQKTKPKGKTAASGKTASPRQLKPIVAWSLVAGALIVAAVPLTLSLQGAVETVRIEPIPEELICHRRCESNNEHCLKTAGRYLPAQERCAAELASCDEECSPTTPEPVAAPQASSRQVCIAEQCRPTMDECLEAAANDQERSTCEGALLQCMTACRMSNPTALPQPGTIINTRPSNPVDPRLINLELATLNQAKQAVAEVADRIQPTADRIAKLQAQGISVPEELAVAMRQATIVAEQSAATTTLDQLRALTGSGYLNKALQLAIEHEALLIDLESLATAYPQLTADIEAEAAWLDTLQDNPEASPAAWQQVVSADFSRLVDTARQSLTQAQGLISNGQAETGLDRLNTGVLDNLRELQAMRRAYDWTLADRAVLEATGLVNRFRARWPASSTGGSGAALDLETATTQLDKLAAAVAADNAELTYFLAKELIDILELAEAAALEAAGEASTPLQEYLK